MNLASQLKQGPFSLLDAIFIGVKCLIGMVVVQVLPIRWSDGDDGGRYGGELMGVWKDACCVTFTLNQLSHPNKLV